MTLPKPALPRVLPAPSLRLALLAVAPGIVFAAMSIGSGEVATVPRVTGLYGYTMLWIVPWTLFLKYFQIESLGRWVVATGEPIFEGFKRVPGPKNWGVWVTMLDLFLAGIGIYGAIIVVNGALLHALVPMPDIRYWHIILLAVMAAAVAVGRYQSFATAMSLTGVVLVVTALVAVFLAKPDWGRVATSSLIPFQFPAANEPWTQQIVEKAAPPIVEIVPMLGGVGNGLVGNLFYASWMLGAGYGAVTMGGSVLRKLETVSSEEKRNIWSWLGYMRLDLIVSTVLTCVVTLAFAILGAAILNPRHIAPSGIGLAREVATIFTQTVGSWGYWIFMFSALAAMLSTSLGFLEGLVRASCECFKSLRGTEGSAAVERTTWKWFLAIYALFTAVVVLLFGRTPIALLRLSVGVDALLFPLSMFMLAYLSFRLLPRLMGKEFGIGRLSFGIHIFVGVLYSVFAIWDLSRMIFG